ncbi:unnamed protein product [Nezara viridula]|uniref:Uncharacterized protein n=1 Tax=Nezara viridula TaxID=85310 RepID=A0A9P0GY07_NEZVI|nr:unnamed protein product [Nezara viridula]
MNRRFRYSYTCVIGTDCTLTLCTEYLTLAVAGSLSVAWPSADKIRRAGTMQSGHLAWTISAPAVLSMHLSTPEPLHNILSHLLLEFNQHCLEPTISWMTSMALWQAEVTPWEPGEGTLSRDQLSMRSEY